MRRAVRFGILASGAALVVLGGCATDDKGPVAPAPVTTDTYQGTVVDPVMAGALGAGYTSTTYDFKLSSNDSFTVVMTIPFGSAVVETGTYVVSGATVTFTGLVNKVSDPATHMMVNAAALKPPYAGTLNGTSLTVDHFTTTGNSTAEQRDLGTLAMTKQ